MAKPSGASDQLLLLESCEDFRIQITRICANARRQIDIFSHSLDYPVYNHVDTVAAISQMVRSHSQARVRILVRDTRPLVENSHRLVRLAQRLPSKIQLRKLTEEPENSDMAYVLCDRDQLVYKNDDREYRGFVNFAAAPEVKNLRETFSRTWELARPDPKLRVLSL